MELTAPFSIDSREVPFDSLEEWAAHEHRRIEEHATIGAATVLPHLYEAGLRRRPDDIERLAQRIKAVLLEDLYRFLESRRVADGDVPLH